MKQFTIIESEWARGCKNGRSALLNDLGTKCCLGFLCLAYGMRAMDILDIGLPTYAVSAPADLRADMGSSRRSDHPSLQGEIAAINDDTAITDAERKKKLAPLFASIGLEPVYV